MGFRQSAVLVTILISSTLFAHVKDGVWQVHRAAYPPVIDGEMDDIWFAASTERVVQLNQDDASEPGYLDLFAEARLLWDYDYIYIYVKVVDDEISCSSQNAYENDSVEFFVNGDGVILPDGEIFDEVQIRIEYQDQDNAATYDMTPGGSEGAVEDWNNPEGDASGYAVEAAFPLAGLNIQPEAGHVFGFELQINDRDDDALENVYRWWSTSNEVWHDAGYWGRAELSDYPAHDVLCVPMASSAPVIDGDLDVIWTDQSVSIESGTYVFEQGDLPGSPYAEIIAWEDLQMEFRLMWDTDALYLWVEVTDDELSVDSAYPWENDGVEIFVDGNNSKEDEFNPTEDRHWGWVWNVSSDYYQDLESTIAWKQNPESAGYICELMIPAVNLNFPLISGQEIGWDIQVNDRDHGTRENIIRWWSGSPINWINPGLWGTLMLGIYGPPPSPPSAIQETAWKVQGFELFGNRPNPFNPRTAIQYQLPEMCHVRLTVYNMKGQPVSRPEEGIRSAGLHRVVFDGSRLSSGVYFYALETETELLIRKMLLIR